MPRDRALASEPAPFLAYALNGEPLTKHQGAPLRLIVPGWYGAPNVKWLSEIVAQEDPYLGKFQAHWYRTLKGEMINGEMKWVETGITHLQLKSFVARVTKNGNAHKVTVIVLNDGTPIKTVEVKVDDGPWKAATADPATTAKYGWKLYHLRLDRRGRRRAHDRVARHRRDRQGAADRAGSREQEDVPRGQLAASAEGHDRFLSLDVDDLVIASRRGGTLVPSFSYLSSPEQFLHGPVSVIDRGIGVGVGRRVGVGDGDPPVWPARHRARLLAVVQPEVV